MTQLFPSCCLARKEWNDKHMKTMHSPSMECATWASPPTCQSFCVQSFSRWFPGSSVRGPCHVSHRPWPGNDYRNIQGTFRAWSQHCGRKRHTLGKFLDVNYICCHTWFGASLWPCVTVWNSWFFSWYGKKYNYKWIRIHILASFQFFSQCLIFTRIFSI